ncbi:c-type cytochrome [Adhaeribacter aquaticus]|uniref:c-type cytochrome n=1 Tax=Adhaeribacter aquaticus TaxID=299567 RepID=UPI00054FA05E|nr:c-type cytochrome [Adhaeribacter aquaticus]
MLAGSPSWAQTSASKVFTQESAKEEDFFKIMRVPAPEGTVLEIGGLAMMPNGDLAVTTRRGDIYMVENPTSLRPHFRKFASGLHEVLGIAYKDGALYCAQRGELTKLLDTNQDGKADVFQTIAALPVTGNYCEYNYGPKIAPDGSFFITCNLAFPEDEWWRPYSRAPWRGWMLRIQENGQIEPWATGMRSPAGIGMVDGEMFYADNQGDWIGSGGIIHVKKGSFTGNPAGLAWTNQPNSPLKLTQEQLFAKVSPRIQKNENGQDIRPMNVVTENFTTLFELKKSIPEIALPAVWLPHGILGISNSEILSIPENTFGPFAGQMLIGDQGQSKIMRVFMEKVNGEYQGAAWDFRSGFQSGVLRMAWAPDGSLFVGETNRGWGSAGEAAQGLQRLVWNNKVPFEMLAVRAMPDGFEVEFTKPVDKKSAADLASYSVESFIYKYHPVYGSPPVNNEKCAVKAVKVSDDGMKVRIVVDNLRKNYIHNITLAGVHETENAFSLVHPTAYYTLNNIPDGPKLTLPPSTKKVTLVADSNKKAPVVKKASAAKVGSAGISPVASVATSKAPSFELVKPLLAKYTCLACHSPDKRQVGPAYSEVAKRKYSDEQIVKLIHDPEPENWPEYATPMPPMPQVPKADALKIAAWINSLNK